MRIPGKLSVMIILGSLIAINFLPAATINARGIEVLASNRDPNDFFGVSVAIDGNTMAVGALQADGPSTSTNYGAVYVYEKTRGNTWTEVAILTASDAAHPSRFGFSVDVSGETVVVGSPSDSTIAVQQGSAYVFEKTGGSWTSMTESAKLTATDGAGFDEFGHDVAIDGDTIVVGSRLDYDNGVFSGSAYIYENTMNDWNTASETKILAADGTAHDWFGWSVAIDRGTVVVGAVHYGEGISPLGSAYVFEHNGLTWQQEAKLTAGDADLNDNFGYSVDISGDTIVVGAAFDKHDGAFSGSAYVFEEPAGGWTDATHDAKLTASDPTTTMNLDRYDRFGQSVAIDGTTIVIGSPYDDDVSPAFDDTDSGSTYIFHRQGGSWVDANEDEKYTAPDAAIGDHFGYSVAVSGNFVAAGAPFSDDIVGGSNSGSVYVFFITPGIGGPSPSPGPSTHANTNAFEGKDNRDDGKSNSHR